MVKCRVRPEEAQAWREAAHEARCSVSELVRRAMGELLERQPVDVQPAASSPLDELLAQYG